jgi:hypothetical protein
LTQQRSAGIWKPVTTGLYGVIELSSGDRAKDSVWCPTSMFAKSTFPF